ncbi:MAG: DUF1622 domain-containing protein [Firmicutes bacterium]|nr:DUF1622 domain-containing protein [Bacillota bacterium]
MDFFTHGVIIWLAGLLDILGALVISSTAVIVFINYWRRLSRAEEILRLSLARGLAFGLEFKLGGEILRTVAVRSLHEVYVLGAIILIRAAMSLLIHWEIRHSLSCISKRRDK